MASFGKGRYRDEMCGDGEYVRVSRERRTESGALRGFPPVAAVVTAMRVLVDTHGKDELEPPKDGKEHS